MIRATGNRDPLSVRAAEAENPSPPQSVALHRLRDVRLQEGLSVREMARRLSISEEELVRQEQETCDVPLSVLYRWQKALEVPVSELLTEPGFELSPPLLKRTQWLRVMRTVNTICERAKQSDVRRMAQNLAEQILAMLPEYHDIQPWPAVGKRRDSSQLGIAAERTLSSIVRNNEETLLWDGK